jgi:hypothetical protein
MGGAPFRARSYTRAAIRASVELRSPALAGSLLKARLNSGLRADKAENQIQASDHELAYPPDRVAFLGRSGRRDGAPQWASPLGEPAAIDVDVAQRP